MLQYAAPIFLGAFLLFQVQPLIARYILPWFGGTPAVWTTCMLFFQMLLLGGYAFAHFVSSRFRPRGQVLAQTVVLVLSLSLLGLLTLVWGVPIIPGSSFKPPDGSYPVLRILFLLAISVGLPYFVLSTTSPLLQSWFSRSFPGKSPYRLYTLSNIGSLLALLSYPFIVEPALALRAQAGIWSSLFVVFVLLYAYCAARVWSSCPEGDASGAPAGEACPLPESGPRPALSTRTLWLALPALASILLLATTNQVCQEVAVVPFLWVVPLSLYLLSFIICFDNERWYCRRAYVPLLVIMVPLSAAMLLNRGDQSMKMQIVGYNLMLFICCMVCHGELVALKPSPKYLTGFYLAVSIGGAIGGLFVGVLAPLAFKGFWELHIALILCWLLGVGTLYYRESIWPAVSRRLSYFLMGATLCIPFIPSCLNKMNPRAPDAFVTRNFYGLLKIKTETGKDPTDNINTLVHGRIIHGYQYQTPDLRRVACSYYGVQSGVGLGVLNHPRRSNPDRSQRDLRIGVIGLGTGSMAVYANKGDLIRFYDINPEVLHIARDSGYFSYLKDCPATVDVVLGDARVSLERELQQGSQRYDAIVLDAFSSDAIPAHLLTREAIEVYLKHLRDRDSLLIVHVSNKALDLVPVVYGLADHFGLNAALIAADSDEYTYHSDWIILTRDQGFLDSPEIADATTRRDGSEKRVGLWTDDYHNLFQILK